MKITKSIVVVLSVLLTAQIASAYYCPSTGRWLSRDPMGEPGFETLRAASVVPRVGQVASSDSLPPGRWINRDSIVTKNDPNRYAMVGNNPVSLIDPLGLCKCGVKSLKAISDGWTVNPNSIVFKFHVIAKFRKGAGYDPSCCKLIQWVQDQTTDNGIIYPADGNQPTDGKLHIDRNPYISDTITDPANYDRMGNDYDSDPAADVLNYTDTPTRGGNPGDVLGGDLRFRMIVYDSCNSFKRVSSTQFGIYWHGTWPKIDYGVE